MGREEQIINERVKKLEEIKKENINPYPDKYDKKQTCLECVESKIKSKVKTAGRLMTKRDLGKIAFCVLRDGTGKIQIVLQDGETPDKVREFFKKYTDVGDFVGVEGEVIKTKTGEISILVKKIDLISKSILPLPEKWKGLQDEEERYRKRYLDILMNDEVKDMFIKKSKFWNTMRSFLIEKGFLEVETPVLETSAGGAAAKPFKTHHNALDIDVYMRISMGELWQKKLMVAGYEKTFEIGRQFRNEGMDMEHLQDYTQMEFYWGYANYEDGMKLVEEMYKKIAKEVFGILKFEIHGHKVDFSKKWEIYDFEKLIKKETGIDIYKADTKEVKKKLNELKVDYDDSVDKWRLIDQLWKYCRKKISGPGFLTGQPVELSPLAKRNPEDKRKVEQFQVIIAGSEVGNGYSELNDPLDQEQRFIEQAKQKDAGDSESMEHDKSFVEALKYGMPPTCGFGVSERLFGFLMGKPLRECVIFPLMRPEEGVLLEKEPTMIENRKVAIAKNEEKEESKKENKNNK
jgi:lysyl-tRNA synthetase class 2